MKKITIGRSTHCDIIVPHERISREHARLSIAGNNYLYEDVGKNGSIVNGRLVQGERLVLAPGTEILLAGKVPLPWSKVYTLLPLRGQDPYVDETDYDHAGGGGHSHNPQPRPVPYHEESIGAGWAILAFLIPIAGWLMYFIWKDETPRRASQACTIAWIAFAINLFFSCTMSMLIFS